MKAEKYIARTQLEVEATAGTAEEAIRECLERSPRVMVSAVLGKDIHGNEVVIPQEFADMIPELPEGYGLFIVQEIHYISGYEVIRCSCAAVRYGAFTVQTFPVQYDDANQRIQAWNSCRNLEFISSQRPVRYQLEITGSLCDVSVPQGSFVLQEDGRWAPETLVNSKWHFQAY